MCSQKMADLSKECVSCYTRTAFVQSCWNQLHWSIYGEASQVKRYCCIFTRLTIRATHIEIAHLYDTDSFINVLCWFIARRGKPVLVRTYNGTKFVSGEKELRTCIQKWNRQRIHEYLLQQKVGYRT